MCWLYIQIVVIQLQFSNIATCSKYLEQSSKNWMLAKMAEKETLWLIGNEIVNELVKACPVDTGRLKNSIQFRIDGEDIIISMANYGENVEFGTPPHIIKPKFKKVLKWKKGGKEFFAKEVKHPGTRPQPFIRHTLHTKLSDIIGRYT